MICLVFRTGLGMLGMLEVGVLEVLDGPGTGVFGRSGIGALRGLPRGLGVVLLSVGLLLGSLVRMSLR